MFASALRTLALAVWLAGLALAANGQCRPGTPHVPSAGNESECRSILDAAVRTGDKAREADAVARLRDLSLAKGAPTDAIRYSSRYVELNERSDKRIELAHALSKHGEVLGGVGRVQESRQADERAVAIYKGLGATNHPLAVAASRRLASDSPPARKRSPGRRSDDNG